jgi:hypothetical protein
MVEFPKVDPDSGHSQGRVTLLLETGLSDEQLRLIGSIAVAWNAAQAKLEQFIALAAGWELSTGALVTADMSAAQMTTLATNVLLNRIADPDALAYSKTTIDLFDAVRIVRNKTIHGLPVAQTEKPTESFMSGTARSRTGLIKREETPVTKEALEDLLRVTHILILAIEGAMFQLWTIDLLVHGHFRKSDRQETLRRATLVSQSRIETVLRDLQSHRQKAPDPKPRPA